MASNFRKAPAYKTYSRIHLSELNSKILEAVVEAYDGGVEVINTVDLNAIWEELNVLNEGWTPGNCWEGVEDKDCVTSGQCWDSEEDQCKCEQDDTVPTGLKTHNAPASP